HNPAISAMKMADPQKAGEVFTSALGSLLGNPKTKTVKALGELKVIGANSLLVNMLDQNNDTELQRNILRALASIGNAESHKALLGVAKSSRYKPEPTGATMALLEYAEELGRSGNKDLSNEICLHLMKKCKTESQIHFKSFALEIYADNAGIKAATPLLVGAMKNGYKSYRMGAINYAIEKSGPSGPWVSELANTKNPEVQAEIIFLLASLNDKSALPRLTKYLNSPDAGVRSEAVSAISC
ncbi:unnamed protein product, partial [marine sediment metagenome]